MSLERVQKILARSGFGSRRASEKLISAGRVRVNDRVATLGDKAESDKDLITVDGKEIRQEEKVYIALYKPRGVLSSLVDELNQGRETLRDIDGVPFEVFPVGRLDRQSEGLMLLTNDGALAHKLTHPSFEHEKEYSITVHRMPTEEELNSWRDGIKLEGKMTAPAKVLVKGVGRNGVRLGVTLKEGRKRQIRRVAALLDLEVSNLRRVRISTLALGEMSSGEVRHLKASEVELLRSDSK